MSCSCKHNREQIQSDYKTLVRFRELFVKRMTVDSPHNDRRKKDYNQAIFHYEDNESIDYWNKYCADYGLNKKEYGETYAVWSEMDMDMVLKCFDDAMKDMRREYCDTATCRKGWQQ